MKGLQVDVHGSTGDRSKPTCQGKVMSEAQMADDMNFYVKVLIKGEFITYDTDYLTCVKRSERDDKSNTKELEEVYG